MLPDYTVETAGRYKIAPSILSADFSKLGEQIAEAEANGADWIHIDVMDGLFVPNITMGQFVVETVNRITDLPLDVHLMIEKPERYLESFRDAGADIITVHLEASLHIHRTLQAIRELGCKAGVALNPGTPGQALEQVLHLADVVLPMTVNPGYSGQTFISEMLPKIRLMREMLNTINPEAYIEVDGGINAETLPLVRDAGAEVFVAASAIFKHEDGIAKGMGALKANLLASE
ncbi:MAG: ribulose-phosphate 3-epimerase [Chloroflexi bacterium]|nr:MAG: ribulose-phosphate 3-epimerase [Chloroflexota bacterium]MBL1196382.1 ribulose-phosphate 3-epimerase [Chloroflexota bacterium]NOH13677.1 ribulose-phosphate 3-epimerase [Chloroflexota bacterium]